MDTYTLTPHQSVILTRDDQTLSIPFDERNTDYQEYLAWLAEGNTPNPYIPPAPPPDPIPQAISDRQFYQQAAVAGIITQAEALAAVGTGTIPAALQTIIDMEQDANKRFSMEMLLSGATIFDRQHQMTSEIGAALGLTESEIDQFFIDAAKL